MIIHPETAMEFMNGNFTVCKNQQGVLSMALDQAHEQNSADIDSDGGAVGLTQSPEALRRWVVAGPELVMMTSEFKASLERKHHKLLDTSYHEQTKSFQVTFGKQDKELVDVIEDMGNPT